jgi:hypothetical protein
MAISPSHQFGEMIGDLIQEAFDHYFSKFAKKHQLYLDKKGRRLCRRGLKCAWTDSNKNIHDLDFVLERGGSSDKFGAPLAFIEIAWRRYTKHSRNKAQEIQSAILPLAETFRHAGPFKGAILAGVFTEGALAQLKSLGFSLVYLPYKRLTNIFRAFDVDAEFDERTPDAEFVKKITALKRLSSVQRTKLKAAILRAGKRELEEFSSVLRNVVLRQVERIVVLTLYGDSHEFHDIIQAMQFLQTFQVQSSEVFQRFEIQIRYSNGNRIEGSFADKKSAIEFVQGFTGR